MSIDKLSAQIAVDPKTIERWISKERVPHRTHRMAVAVALGKDDVFLWPSTLSDPRTQSASQAEFVAMHPSRGTVPANTWTSLLDQATESIDLLAYAASFLHDSIADFGPRLMDKARQGVQVRLLFGDPTSEAVRRRGEEEGIKHLLAARCELTWAYFAPVLTVPGVTARQHGETVYNSIFRFDDVLLANTHTFGAAASQSPIITSSGSSAGGCSRRTCKASSGPGTALWRCQSPKSPSVDTWLALTTSKTRTRRRRTASCLQWSLSSRTTRAGSC